MPVTAPEKPLDTAHRENIGRMPTLRTLMHAIACGAALTIPTSTSAEDPGNDNTPRVQRNTREEDADRRWLRTIDGIATHEAIRELVGHRDIQLDSRDFFERERAHKDILKLMRGMRGIIHPPPPVLFDTLKSPSEVPLTLEQKVRTKSVMKHEADRLADHASRLPPHTATAEMFCGEIRRYFGMDLHIPDTLRKRFAEATVTTTLQNNDFSRTIITLCKATNTLPRWNQHTLEFLASDDPKARLLALDRACIVWQEGKEKNSEDSITLVPDPQWSPGMVNEVILEGPWKKDAVVHLPGCEPWTMQRHNVREAYDKKTRRDAQDQPTPAIVIESWAPSNAVETSFVIGKTQSRKLGFQEIDIVAYETPEGWECTLMNEVYKEVPWPRTSSATDQQTYAAADATRFVLWNAQGQLLPYRTTDVCINQRMMTTRLRCKERPQTVSLWTYNALQRERRTIPLDGNRSDREILESNIEIKPVQ